MTSALQHIKVVDLTRTLAGPFCSMMLGDMGADVIKIEEPERGDETRAWTPFWHGESTQFLSFNRNKRSLSLNLKAPEAVDIVLALARDADIMIESFRAGALERMGLGYEAVRRLNPDIIYCSISGYGRTGPLADKPGYDLLIQGYSGLMSLTGEPDGLPLRVGFSLVDLFTGMMAYGAIVTALYHRDQTGQGFACCVGRLRINAHPFDSICSKCVTALCRLKNMRARPSVPPSGDCCTTFST